MRERLRVGVERESEVEQERAALRRDAHVRGLHVAVHDADGVRGGERARDVARPAYQLLDARVAVRAARGGEELVEARAAHELHREVRDVVRAPRLVDRDDVRVEELRDRACFAFEACSSVGGARELGPQHLERDRTTEAFVLGAVDDAHAARAELLEEAVAAEALEGEFVRVRGRRARAAERARELLELRALERTDLGVLREPRLERRRGAAQELVDVRVDGELGRGRFGHGARESTGPPGRAPAPIRPGGRPESAESTGGVPREPRALAARRREHQPRENPAEL